MQSLVEYAKALGAKSLNKVNGPNGAFISIVMKDGNKITLPVGKKSQAGSLSEYNILVTTDTNQAIATVNHYEEVEAMLLD